MIVRHALFQLAAATTAWTGHQDFQNRVYKEKLVVMKVEKKMKTAEETWMSGEFGVLMQFGWRRASYFM